MSKEVAMKFIDKSSMIKVIPETKENVLEKVLLEYWMFKDNPQILKMIVEYVEKGLISVDISNLQGDTWDGFLRIRIKDASTYAMMQLISPIVMNCRPDEMRVLSQDVIQFWWD